MLIEHRRTHPEIAAATITEPIVIVGQGRTGTTILYDLRAQDRNHRVPLTWASPAEQRVPASLWSELIVAARTPPRSAASS